MNSCSLVELIITKLPFHANVLEKFLKVLIVPDNLQGYSLLKLLMAKDRISTSVSSDAMTTALQPDTPDWTRGFCQQLGPSEEMSKQFSSVVKSIVFATSLVRYRPFCHSSVMNCTSCVY